MLTTLCYQKELDVVLESSSCSGVQAVCHEELLVADVLSCEWEIRRRGSGHMGVTILRLCYDSRR